MRRRHTLFMIIISSLLASALAACGASIIPETITVVETVEVVKEVEVEKEVVVTAAPSAATQGGTLIVARTTDANCLDPHNAGGLFNWALFDLMFDRLVDIGSDGKLVPSLAESWEISDDGLTYILKLKEGINFHDGTPFNAEAVKWNVERGGNPDTAKNTSGRWGVISEANIIDDYMIEFKLEEPSATLLPWLHFGDMVIMSPASVEEWGDKVCEHPVGTGPFVFEEWVPGDQITIVRNPDYINVRPYVENPGPPYLEKVVLRVIPEPATRRAALETGAIHIDQDPLPQTVRQLAYEQGFNVFVQSKGSNVNRLEFEVTKPPFDDPLVRQAFAHIVDPDVIVNNLLEGLATINLTLIPTGAFGFTEEDFDHAYNYDPEQAGALLEEAGWIDSDGDGIREKDGQTLDVVMWASPGLGPLPISEFIQSEANGVGFNVNLESFEYGIMRSTLAEGTPNAVLMQFNTPHPDTVYSSWLWPGKSPFSRWENEAFASLGEEARQLTDIEAAAKLYREMSQIAIDEAVVVPIYTTRYAVATTNNVNNVVLPPSGWNFLMTLNDAYLQE